MKHDWRDFAARSRKDRTAGSFRKTRGDMMADKDRPLDRMREWETLSGTRLMKRTNIVGAECSCIWKGGMEYIGEYDHAKGVIVMTGLRY